MFEQRHRLSLALEVSGVAIQAMADELGVHRNTVSNYLAGRTMPPRSAVKVWALRCGVPYGWLADGLDNAPNGPGTPGDMGNQTSPCMTDDLAAFRARRSTAHLPAAIAA